MFRRIACAPLLLAVTLAFMPAGLTAENPESAENLDADSSPSVCILIPIKVLLPVIPPVCF